MNKFWTKENFAEKNFNNILVVSIAKDSTTGTAFENAIVNALKAKGANATNSVGIIPQNSGKEISDDQIQSAIDKGNYDGIMVSWLADVQTRKISTTGPDGYDSEVFK